MAKNTNAKKNKQPFIKTRQRKDNSVEVEFTKSPSKTLAGKIFSWVIAIGTILVPLIGLIYLFTLL